MGLPAAFALMTPLYFFDLYWGRDLWSDFLWSDFAPAWPGGAYAFAASVGAVMPLVFLVWVWPLTRMNWKRSKPRSLGWAAASLPGLAAGYVGAGVITATIRPKRRRDWDGACYREGGPCWVHVHYPWLWAAGLVATLTVVVLLITLFVKYGGRSCPTAPSTSEPEAAPTPRSPTDTGDRRPPG